MLAFCEYQGDLVVGGSFHTIGTQVIEHVARWDGTIWRPFGSGMNGAVSQLAVQGDELLAAGDFTEAGGMPANHIASWRGTAWRALGAGVDGTPQALAVYRDTLFVGGRFQRAGDLTVKGIARWDGQAWHDGATETDLWYLIMRHEPGRGGWPPGRNLRGVSTRPRQRSDAL